MKIKKMMKSKVVDYFMVYILTTVVMITIYQLATRGFFDSMWVVYLMMGIFGLLTIGASVWIMSLTDKVDELEEEVFRLKSGF